MGKAQQKIALIAQQWSKKNAKLRPTIFLDRDGTLIRQRKIVSEKAHMKPMRGVADALKKLQSAGFLLIVVTNQPPIEKGEVSLTHGKKLNEYLHALLDKEGVTLDAIYTCPHRHATGCACKKPAQGMIEKAQKDFRIDMKKSWFVGDTRTDMETARCAGLKSILVGTGSRTKDAPYFSTVATYDERSLTRATGRIISLLK